MQSVLNKHAVAMARKEKRPYIYLASSGMRKAQRARAMAAEDGIEEGLVCLFAQLEPCSTFSFRYERGQAFVQPARRKCLHVTEWVPMRKGVANLFCNRDLRERLAGTALLRA